MYIYFLLNLIKNIEKRFYKLYNIFDSKNIKIERVDKYVYKRK